MYGQGVATGSTARRVSSKSRGSSGPEPVLSPPMPSVEVSDAPTSNAGADAPPPAPQPAPPPPVVVTLPQPPAANTYLRRHGTVTYKTHEAKAYCELVAQLTQAHRVNGGPVFPEGDVSVVVVWHRAMRAGDLGERTKVLYDALQGSLYTDDKQIAQDWRRRCDGHPSIAKGFVRIEVSHYTEPFPETLR